MAFEWKHLTKADASVWSELTKAIAAADRHHLSFEPDVAAARVETPGMDAARDTWAVWDGETLVAYAYVLVHEKPRYDGKAQAHVAGGVHPDWRKRGIGTELLGRVEARAQELLESRHPALPHVIVVESGDDQDPAWDLLVNNGFQRARYFHDMKREVTAGEALPDLSHPHEGVTVRPVLPSDQDAVRLAHNDAFQSHWGSGPNSEEEWAAEFTASTMRLEWSRVAVDENGRVLAYALVGEWRGGHPYIMLVGARPETRGRGLGRAALSELLRGAAAEPSIECVYLDVDSENATGAGSLYERLGFEKTRTWAAFQKELES